MTSRQIATLRPSQIQAELERLPLAYLPIGLLEWHGPHLPFGLDAFNAENAAKLAAEQTGGLVLPTLYMGTERERPANVLSWLGFQDEYIVGMDFPANSLPSMYASEEVFGIVIREHLRLARSFGFKHVVLVSGHGAENHLSVLQRLANEFNGAGDLKVLLVMPFVRNSAGVMEVGHASRVETAIMLVLDPDTVDMSALPQDAKPLRNVDHAIVDYQTFLGDPTPDNTVHEHDDPRLATPESGQEIIQAAVSGIVDQVKLFLSS